MKEVQIDRKKLIIYQDGSIRIPHKGMHLCLDFMDIEFLYNELKKDLSVRIPDRKDTDRKLKQPGKYVSNRELKELKLTDLKTERRGFKRHRVNRRPIAILGPDPVRVGHVTVISDEAAEIQFSESKGKAANKFSELVVLVPDFNSPFLSGKIHVETVSCSGAPTNGNRSKSRMRKCVISLNN